MDLATGFPIDFQGETDLQRTQVCSLAGICSRQWQEVIDLTPHPGEGKIKRLRNILLCGVYPEVLEETISTFDALYRSAKVMGRGQRE